MASRHYTRTLTEHTQGERAAQKRTKQYQRFIINQLHSACSDEEIYNAAIKTFLSLADTLKNSSAIQFLDQPHLNEELALKYQQATEAASSESSTPYLCLAQLPNLLHDLSTHEGLIHPLLVAVLAYCMGGPINAANKAYGHEWRTPVDKEARMLHMEGDNGDILDDYRLTFVWEHFGDAMQKPSGDHHIFLTGDTTPHQLPEVSSTRKERDSSAVTILYNAQNVALYYECEDAIVSRRSISLDFHVNYINNDDLLMLDITPSTDTKFKELTLPNLITQFPIQDYDFHFHRLLFHPSSLASISTTLSTLSIPHISHLPSPLPTLKFRYEIWHADNLSHIPRSLASHPLDPLLGTYTTPIAFQQRLCLEMRLDIHRPLGCDMFPRSRFDAHREWARTWIRDLPSETIFTHLTPYHSSLCNFPITRDQILPTKTLKWLAEYIEQKALSLMERCGENGGGLLYSMGCLARSLGEVLDGMKEGQVVEEPWIDETDLWVFRARCVYLFWCAEWVAGFMCGLGDAGVDGGQSEDITEGVEGKKKVREREQREMRGVAVSLLGNWRAWACVVEGLAERPFQVRKSVV